MSPLAFSYVSFPPVYVASPVGPCIASFRVSEGPRIAGFRVLVHAQKLSVSCVLFLWCAFAAFVFQFLLPAVTLVCPPFFLLVRYLCCADFGDWILRVSTHRIDVTAKNPRVIQAGRIGGLRGG